jgi:hypothetical protein
VLTALAFQVSLFYAANKESDKMADSGKEEV